MNKKAKQQAECVSLYKYGDNPEIDAWLTIFFIENHLDHYSYPDHVVSPEQARFMVYIDTERAERYYPCSDIMFDAIIGRNQSGFLQKKYNEVLQKMLALIDSQIKDSREKSYLESLVIIKYKHETRDEIMLPSRLEKRLLKIFTNHTMIDDPFLDEKKSRNMRAGRALNSEAFKQAINHVDLSGLENPPSTLSDIRSRVDRLELQRLVSLMGEKNLWESDSAENFTKDDYLKIFNNDMSGEGVEPLLDFLGISEREDRPDSRESKMILWLANEAGEIIVDLAVIRYLAKLGHKVIIAFKDGFLFSHVTCFDIENDEILGENLEDAVMISDDEVSKNDLVRILRSDKKIWMISDGTRERMNLLHASITFTRIFKEVDGVISRGEDQKRRFFDTCFQFTQDVFNITSGSGGPAEISYKPRHPDVIKFSHTELEKKAKNIIDQMIDAGKKGMTVIFYSGIIGSIPGKIDVAKKIMSVFIEYLQEQYAETFIINPSEYYEPGMDADDLMYMWEIVQRSGYINIWRFQTYQDIVKAFEKMNEKVPPEWVGKDATYSTGCTKEMAIAVDVQKKHPEMQLTGPAEEKFMRRKDYGVGKMYDARLASVESE